MLKRVLPFLLLLLVAAAPAQLTTDGKKSGLKAADLKRIRASKLKFLVPTQVPKGYKVMGVELNRDKEPVMVTLSITYTKGGSEILLQQTSEGIGDVFFGEEADDPAKAGAYRISSKLFPGKHAVEYQTTKGQAQWIVNWIELPGKSYPRFVSAIGTASSGRTGVEFMESLRYLR